MDGRQVLAAFDDSPASHAAVQWAASYADSSKKPLFIALAADIADPDEIDAGSIDESAILIDGVVAELRSEHPGLPIETIVADEPPVQMIERLGDRASLLVLGATGGSRVSDAILGSAAYRIAADARCPVILIPTDTIVWPPVHRPQKVVVGASDSANGAAAVRFAAHYAAEVGGLVTIVRGFRVPCGVGGDHAQPAQNTQQRLLDDLVALGRRCNPRVEITTQLLLGSGERALWTQPMVRTYLSWGDGHRRGSWPGGPRWRHGSLPGLRAPWRSSEIRPRRPSATTPRCHLCRI